MIGLWKAILLRGRPPQLIAIIIFALIPKNVGDRPVAIFASFLRLLTRWFRRQWGVPWAARQNREFIYGRAGWT
eukprot:602289-Karenia_brevis.AAC.1